MPLLRPLRINSKFFSMAFKSPYITPPRSIPLFLPCRLSPPATRTFLLLLDYLNHSYHWEHVPSPWNSLPSHVYRVPSCALSGSLVKRKVLRENSPDRLTRKEPRQSKSLPDSFLCFSLYSICHSLCETIYTYIHIHIYVHVCMSIHTYVYI